MNYSYSAAALDGFKSWIICDLHVYKACSSIHLSTRGRFWILERLCENKMGVSGNGYYSRRCGRDRNWLADEYGAFIMECCLVKTDSWKNTIILLFVIRPAQGMVREFTELKLHREYLRKETSAIECNSDCYSSENCSRPFVNFCWFWFMSTRVTMRTLIQVLLVCSCVHISVEIIGCVWLNVGAFFVLHFCVGNFHGIDGTKA